MINSIKQLLRTPFKVILFFLLVAMSTALLVLGIHLWSDTTQKLNAMEESFTTIGTVTQKEDSMVSSNVWDAGTKTYTIYRDPVYNKVISESVLQFEGANYLKGPYKRPYYGAYMPDYVNVRSDDYKNFDMRFIVEFSPVEDCIPNKPVRVNIVKTLAGKTYGSDQFWFCDHFTKEPQPIYADKTYIAYLLPVENTHVNNQIGQQFECIPYYNPVYSSQYDKTGKKLESKINFSVTPSCEEVTDDFYTTGRGKNWLNFIESMNKLEKTNPVLPTQGIELLPAFHSGDSAIVDGRVINEEEFQSGNRVCLITAEFARLNELSVGDKISLPLYFANHDKEPSIPFGYLTGSISFSLLNAQGELYPVFWEAEYEIVGIYKYSGKKSASGLGGTEMARDMIIIPSKSVGASDENNIVYFGPMEEFTTSFQIPNGTIAEFEAAFQKAVPDSSLLEITYDDNGYEQISEDIKSTRNIAVLLGAIGLFSTLAILMLLLYFFVIKQKKRTAIERSLGLSKRQCRISIITGIMVLTVVATTLGSLGSSVLMERMKAIEKTNQMSFNTKYSNWTMDEVDSELMDNMEIERTYASWYFNLTLPAILNMFMLISSVIFINRNLKIEPILLLSTKGD